MISRPIADMTRIDGFRRMHTREPSGQTPVLPLAAQEPGTPVPHARRIGSPVGVAAQTDAGVRCVVEPRALAEPGGQPTPVHETGINLIVFIQ